MAGTRERAVRSAIAALVLPHELGHALLARLFRLETEVTLLPSWDGDPAPLARVNATLDADTPTPVIRTVAVASLPLALAAAWTVGAVLPGGRRSSFRFCWRCRSGGRSPAATSPSPSARGSPVGRGSSSRRGRRPSTPSLTPLTVVAVGTLLLR